MSITDTLGLSNFSLYPHRTEDAQLREMQSASFEKKIKSGITQINDYKIEGINNDEDGTPKIVKIEMSADEVKKLADWIVYYKNKLIKEGKAEGIIKSSSNTTCPRSFQVTPEKNIIVHFNKNNETLIQKGRKSKIKLSLFLLFNTILARATPRSEQADPKFSRRSVRQLSWSQRLGDNPYIIKIYKFHEFKSKRRFLKGQLLMQFHRRGDLFTAIGKQTLTFKEKVIIAKKGLETLLALEKSQLIHRDIKPENILLNKNKEPVFADLELMCHMEEHEQRKKSCGTEWYFPPKYAEACNSATRMDLTTPRRNVYEFGVTLAFLFYNSYIEESKKKEPTYPCIIKALSMFKKYPQHQPLTHIIFGMIELDESKRLHPKRALELFETTIPC